MRVLSNKCVWKEYFACTWTGICRKLSLRESLLFGEIVGRAGLYFILGKEQKFDFEIVANHMRDFSIRLHTG